MVGKSKLYLTGIAAVVAIVIIVLLTLNSVNIAPTDTHGLLSSDEIGFAVQSVRAAAVNNPTSRSNNNNNACTGAINRSCTIHNGEGIQYRTCSKNHWSSWSDCKIVTCNPGYITSGNARSGYKCVKYTCPKYPTVQCDGGTIIQGTINSKTGCAGRPRCVINKTISTCTDSDDGQNYIQAGIVSGTTDGNPYSYNDYCNTDAKTLNEYYCIRNGFTAVISKNCPNGCIDGACIQNTNVTPICTDSDSGNPLVYGEACTSDGSCAMDYCNFDGNQNNVLVERVCQNGVPFGNSMLCNGTEPYCYEGACSAIAPTCADSDGGINPGTLGSVKIHRTLNEPASTDYCEIGTNPKDTCIGSTCSLREFYCSGLELNFTDTSCPNGCSNGVCINTSCIPLMCEEPAGVGCYLQNQTHDANGCITSCGQVVCNITPTNCSDSDGGLNYFVKGSATGYEFSGYPEVNYTDYCFCDGPNPGCNDINEISCTNGYVKQNRYVCPNGCSNGACLQNIETGSSMRVDSIKINNISGNVVFRYMKTSDSYMTTQGKFSQVGDYLILAFNDISHIVALANISSGYESIRIDGNGPYRVGDKFNLTQSLMPERTAFPVPLPNVDLAVLGINGNTLSVTVAFKNNKGVGITLNPSISGNLASSFACSQGSAITAQYNGQTITQTTNIPNGAGFLITWNCYGATPTIHMNDMLNLSLQFYYTNSETTQSLTEEGTVLGRVTQNITNCIQYATPSQDWCINGTVSYVVDNNGCMGPPKCITNTTVLTCNDTDFGFDLNTKGTVTGVPSTNLYSTVAVSSTDYCDSTNNYLTEYYCGANDYSNSIQVFCPFGCSDGKCGPVPEVKSLCADTEATPDQYTKGTIYNQDNSPLEYSYFSEQTYSNDVSAQVLSNNNANVNIYGEVKTMHEGETAHFAIADIHVFKILFHSVGNSSNQVYYEILNIKDYCESTSMLREFYCSNSNIDGDELTCPYGCVDGACLAQSPSAPANFTLAKNSPMQYYNKTVQVYGFSSDGVVIGVDNELASFKEGDTKTIGGTTISVNMLSTWTNVTYGPDYRRYDFVRLNVTNPNGTASSTVEFNSLNLTKTVYGKSITYLGASTDATKAIIYVDGTASSISVNTSKTVSGLKIYLKSLSVTETGTQTVNYDGIASVTLSTE